MTDPRNDQPLKVDIELVRYDATAFDLSVTHSEYAVSLRRSVDATAFALPKHQVVFYGAGATDDDDHLTPQGIVARMITPRTSLSMYLPLLLQADPKIVSLMLQGFLQVSMTRRRSDGRSATSPPSNFPSLAKCAWSQMTND